jgi:hypothetical protein
MLPSIEWLLAGRSPLRPQPPLAALLLSAHRIAATGGRSRRENSNEERAETSREFAAQGFLRRAQAAKGGPRGFLNLTSE